MDNKSSVESLCQRWFDELAHADDDPDAGKVSVSVRVPRETVVGLDFLAGKLSKTRSGVAGEALPAAVADLCEEFGVPLVALQMAAYTGVSLDEAVESLRQEVVEGAG